MARRGIFWQLFPAFVLVTVLSLVAVTVMTTRALRTAYRERTAEDLGERARALAGSFESWFPVGAAPAERDSVCREIGRQMSARITVVALDGTVLGDSDEASQRMDNHALREEISAALSGSAAHSVRFSRTLHRNLMYQAVPIQRGGEVREVLRLAVPLRLIDEELTSLRRRIALGALVVALLAAVVAWIISRRFSLPLERLRRGVQRFAAGDLAHRLPPGTTSEVAHLTIAMNDMAAQLDARIRTVERQRDELEAVFAGMVEGVLLIDARRRIVHLNDAGAELLGVMRVPTLGRTVEEALHNPALLGFVARAQAGEENCEEDLELPAPDGGTTSLQVHGVRLARPGEPSRTLVVMHDVTRLRRLESVRRDFVANVSHELKTPVTSIKGFVETLREGALDDPDDARRFLDIVARQAERLQAIIEDLLSLSRLEQGTGDAQRTMGLYPVEGILASAAQTCQLHADSRGIDLVVQSPAGLTARLDPPLMEQALVNLIENAVKYNDEGTRVTISAAADGDEVVLTVADDGRGIEAHHLPRLFERFYRVDKARSRQQGGTGLGLAIVKHIALFHEGDVEVRSAPGAGSEFRIRIPGVG